MSFSFFPNSIPDIINFVSVVIFFYVFSHSGVVETLIENVKYFIGFAPVLVIVTLIDPRFKLVLKIFDRANPLFFLFNSELRVLRLGRFFCVVVYDRLLADVINLRVGALDGGVLVICFVDR